MSCIDASDTSIHLTLESTSVIAGDTSGAIGSSSVGLLFSTGVLDWTDAQVSAGQPRFMHDWQALHIGSDTCRAGPLMRTGSITQGRGNFTQEFDHYDRVPSEVAARVVGSNAPMRAS